MFTYKKDNFNVPIKSWIPEEQYYSDMSMVEQCENLAKLPFTFHHISLSPDGHVGYGMPIGGVIATKDVVIPNAVGVDIGCGMCAYKTPVKEITVEQIKKIMGAIRISVPVGFEHHKESQNIKLLPDREEYGEEIHKGIIERQWEAALHQVGTLGGGNHFIEIQKGSDGYIWLMIHSGSRNLGKQVADYYNKQAVELNAKWHSKIPPEWELAFLPIDSKEGHMYLKEMKYCVDFALANRRLMMKRIMLDFSMIAGCSFMRLEDDRFINIAHNYAAIENHFGKDVWVHRKGATLARVDTVGIIPGSQGTHSYIVQGKGNPDSFQSCSHGAGRKMGRNVARKTLSLEDEKKRLDDLGIVHAIRNEKDLDEAPGAYKDIDIVMRNQADLIDIKVELTPLAVIKA
jgi:tRNA-splicing ligase RtcB